jgi:hypothetical protein
MNRIFFKFSLDNKWARLFVCVLGGTLIEAQTRGLRPFFVLFFRYISLSVFIPTKIFLTQKGGTEK